MGCLFWAGVGWPSCPHQGVAHKRRYELVGDMIERRRNAGIELPLGPKSADRPEGLSLQFPQPTTCP